MTETLEQQKENSVSAVNDERFYVIVPEVVTGGHSHPMEAGRLMAQTFHLGRVVEHHRAVAGIGSEDITTIILAVRNSKELDKVHNELDGRLSEEIFAGKTPFALSVYRDHNPDVYRTGDRVLTAVCVGPVLKATVDSVLGHLELF